MPDPLFDETFLIAENDSMMRGLLRTALECPGRRLLLCADGAEAVGLATAFRVTLVLLDYRMPRMNGIEACRQIRELPGYAAAPIIMLSVFDQPHTKRMAIRAGVTAFLAKPFSRDQLLRAITPLITVPVLEEY